MDEETVNELMKIKNWLQDYLSKLEHDKDQLMTFIESIDTLVEKEVRIEEIPPTSATLAEVRRVFNEELLNVLAFSQEGNTVIIRRQQYLERDTWLTVNAKVDELQGRWISAGEESRWEIPIR